MFSTAQDWAAELIFCPRHVRKKGNARHVPVYNARRGAACVSGTWETQARAAKHVRGDHWHNHAPRAHTIPRRQSPCTTTHRVHTRSHGGNPRVRAPRSTERRATYDEASSQNRLGVMQSCGGAQADPRCRRGLARSRFAAARQRRVCRSMGKVRIVSGIELGIELPQPRGCGEKDA